MRTITIITVVCLTLSQATGQESTLTLDTPFTHLKVSGNIHLELMLSESHYLTSSSKESLDALDVKYDDNRLILKTKSELNKAPSINLKLHYIKLSTLEITKGGVVQSGDILHAETLQIDALTGGKVELTIQVDSLLARVNQGADIILYGNVRSQVINAYSWGNYLAYELISENSFVKAATGAQVKINTLNLLDANATSKAFVGYSGNPQQKRIKASVGGEITPMSE